MTPNELAALHAQSFTVPRPFSAVEFENLLSAQGAIFHSNGAGFVLGRVIEDEAELLTIAVDPAKRRRGHGRQLVEHFLQAARLRGAKSVFLEVDAGNTAAVTLYIVQGFREVGRRPGYYQHSDGTRRDALTLRHDL